MGGLVYVMVDGSMMDGGWMDDGWIRGFYTEDTGDLLR